MVRQKVSLLGEKLDVSRVWDTHAHWEHRMLKKQILNQTGDQQTNWFNKPCKFVVPRGQIQKNTFLFLENLTETPKNHPPPSPRCFCKVELTTTRSATVLLAVLAFRSRLGFQSSHWHGGLKSICKIYTVPFMSQNPSELFDGEPKQKNILMWGTD